MQKLGDRLLALPEDDVVDARAEGLLDVAAREVLAAGDGRHAHPLVLSGQLVQSGNRAGEPAVETDDVRRPLTLDVLVVGPAGIGSRTVPAQIVLVDDLGVPAGHLVDRGGDADRAQRRGPAGDPRVDVECGKRRDDDPQSSPLAR